jgi:hypothetical protein
MRHAISFLVVIAACSGTTRPPPQVRMSPREIIDSSSPAIVRIEAGEPGSPNRAKVGTGFILDKEGLIVTNLHVIAGESDIRVKLYKDPTEYPATVIVGVDKNHDLALLRIRPRKALPVVRLGDSSAVSAGDRVYAIGNPLGLFDYSITDGLISQVRPVTPDLTILQISAAISQGSSGGPLFNQFGEVIGVTTAIITEGQAINLAMPANYIRPLMKEQAAISTQEFAKLTSRADREFTRQIPDHDVAIWKGCNEKHMDDVLRAIGEAISIGAPLYNLKTPQGYEACFRVYEGTHLKMAKEGGCSGIREAFDAGLTRAKAITDYQDKAWALRDSFDGLLKVFEKFCKQDAKCMQKFGQP